MEFFKKNVTKYFHNIYDYIDIPISVVSYDIRFVLSLSIISFDINLLTTGWKAPNFNWTKLSVPKVPDILPLKNIPLEGPRFLS